MREWFREFIDGMSRREATLWVLALLALFWAGVFQLIR